MTTAGGQISVAQMGIGNVLKNYRLQVPPNQREYSWTKDEVTTLLQDFYRAISDDEPEYFLGTIVTVPNDEHVLQVVDGQQRLATTAILLSEIRNYLAPTEDLIAKSIDGDFLSHTSRGKREVVPKLALNVDDNEFFRRLITSWKSQDRWAPLLPSHHLILGAANHAAKQIKAIVAGMNQKDHGDALNQWVDFVEHRAKVLLLQVPSEVNAYKMFETLNWRGLDTSQADLVKNYLFGQSGKRLPEAQNKWTLLKGALETFDEDEILVNFLRHAVIAMHGYVRQPEVYERIQSTRGPQAAIILLHQLSTLATTYVAILNFDDETWNGYPDAMRSAIRALRLLNIKPMRPLMLAVAAKFPIREATAAFQRFISWGVRFLIAGITRSGSVEQPMAAAAKKVYTEEITTSKRLSEELRNIVPTDEEFRQLFEIASVSKAALARYFLRSLERTAKGETEPWFIPNDDKETINLEHILPENPEKEWPGFDREKRLANVSKLGNQALLLAKQNCDLRSAKFSVKKAAYKKTPYLLTRQIADADDWTPEQIALRQKGLASLALKTWPL